MMRFLAFVVSLSIFLRASLLPKLHPIFSDIYIYALIICLFYFLCLKNQINKIVLLFVVIGVISIVFNDVDPFFKSWERLGLFLLLLYVCGPLNQSSAANVFRNNVWVSVKYLSIVFTLLSFVVGVMEIPFFVNKGFSGISVHSMTLAPIAAVSTLICLNEFFRKGKYYRFYFLSFVVSFATVFLTASRGALGALVVACCVFFFLFLRNNPNKGKRYVLMVCLLGGIVVMTNIGGVMDNLYYKIDSRDDNILSGRDVMLVDRFLDFTESPLIGVGFASASNITNTKIDYELGTIEPGSSFIFILSSMGILGLISYLGIWGTLIRTCFKKNYMDIVGVVAIFFFFHSLFEGYAISAGSPLCALMWLFIALQIKLSLKFRS